MSRTAHNALLILALVTLAGVSRAAETASAVGPALPDGASARSAERGDSSRSSSSVSTVPESERKALGSPGRPTTKPVIKPGSAGSKAEPGKNALFSGIAGPFAIVLLLIAMLAGVVVLIARARGGLAASLGAGGAAPAGILEVLGRYPIGRGLTLVLLKVDRRVLLLSQSRVGRFGGLQLSPICELETPEDVASILMKVRDGENNSLTNRFAAVFKSLDRQAAETVDVVPVSNVESVGPAEWPPTTRRASHAPSPSPSPRAGERTGDQAAVSIRRRLNDLRTRAPSTGGNAG